jgi:hypothetical protein
LVYISKDDLCIQEYELEITDPISEECLQQIKILNKAWEEQTPPEPQPAYINGRANWLATYCDYHEFCTGDKDWAAKAKHDNALEKTNGRK